MVKKLNLLTLFMVLCVISSYGVFTPPTSSSFTINDVYLDKLEASTEVASGQNIFQTSLLRSDISKTENTPIGFSRQTQSPTVAGMVTVPYADDNGTAYPNYSHSGFYKYVTDDIWLIGDENKLYISYDKGATLVELDSVPYVDTRDTRMIFVTKRGYILWGPPNYGKIRISTDNGETFSDCLDFGDASGTTLPWSMAETDNGWLFTGNYGVTDAATVWRSKDGGVSNSWEVVYSDPTESHIHRVAFDPYNNGVGYVITGDVQKELWKTTDYGDSFSLLTGVTNLLLSVEFLPNARIFGDDDEGKIFYTEDDITFESVYQSPDVMSTFDSWQFGGNIYMSQVALGAGSNPWQIIGSPNGRDWTVLLLGSKNTAFSGLQTISEPDSSGLVFGTLLDKPSAFDSANNIYVHSQGSPRDNMLLGSAFESDPFENGWTVENGGSYTVVTNIVPSLLGHNLGAVNISLASATAGSPMSFWSREIILGSETNLTASFFLKGETKLCTLFTIAEFFDSSGTSIEVQDSLIPWLWVDGWRRYNANFVAPSGAVTMKVGVKLSSIATGATTDLYVAAPMVNEGLSLKDYASWEDVDFGVIATNDLHLAYTFSDSDTNLVTDVSLNGNAGTNTDAFVTGNFLSITGSPSNVEFPAPANPTNYTLVVRMRLTDPLNSNWLPLLQDRALASKNPGGGIYIRTGSGFGFVRARYFDAGTGSIDIDTANGTVPLTTDWFTLVVVVNGRDMSVWKGGVEYAASGTSDRDRTVDTTWRFGSNWAPSVWSPTPSHDYESYILYPYAVSDSVASSLSLEDTKL